MTKSEFWLHFAAALRKGTSLREELTRVPLTDVKMEPEDWTTMYSVADVAKRFKVDERVVRNWIKAKKLPAKKIGREYVVTLAGIKDMLNYDPAKLKQVPWTEIGVKKSPRDIYRLYKQAPTKWAALVAEMEGLKRLHG